MTLRSPLIEILVEHGSIVPAELERAIAMHMESGSSLAEILVRESLMDEADLFFLMSRRLGVPAIPETRLLNLALSPELRRRVPVSLAKARLLLPLDLDPRRGVLSVAMFDPTDWTTLELLRETSRVAEVKCYLARRTAIVSALNAVYSAEDERRPAPQADTLPYLGGYPASAGPAKPKRKRGERRAAAVDPGAKVELDPSLVAEIEAISDPLTAEKTRSALADQGSSAQPRSELNAPSYYHPAEDILEYDPPDVETVPPLAPEDRTTIHQSSQQKITYIRHEVDALGSDIEDEDRDRTRLSHVREISARSLIPWEVEEAKTNPYVAREQVDQEEAGLEQRESQTAILDHEPTIITTPLQAIGTPVVPLPDIRQMEELDSLLRELLSSVGILVAMLEERIDPMGGSFREYGRLSRLVARELGLDELAVSRVALGAHLYSLDLALRGEVGMTVTQDIRAAFSIQPSAPGGLGPSLRMLGARALSLTDDDAQDTLGIEIIRVVADFLELSAETAEHEHDVETISQLLRTGGGDSMIIDALVQAISSSDTGRMSVRS